MIDRLDDLRDERLGHRHEVVGVCVRDVELAARQFGVAHPVDAFVVEQLPVDLGHAAQATADHELLLEEPLRRHAHEQVRSCASRCGST